MLFPVLIVNTDAKNFLSHRADIAIEFGKISQIYYAIHASIAQLLNFFIIGTAPNARTENLLKFQPHNLNEQFPDRYGYVVGCHKRNRQHFFQQMTPDKQQAFLQQLKSDYRQILINYFSGDRTVKQKIDGFIDTVFSANVPVPQIIEIHMELIEEFSKQLRLEGRSDDVLLDYRLTLIDILAHLCEVYRCSPPK